MLPVFCQKGLKQIQAESSTWNMVKRVNQDHEEHGLLKEIFTYMNRLSLG